MRGTANERADTALDTTGRREIDTAPLTKFYTILQGLRREKMAANDPGGTARSTTCKTRSCCKCNGSGVCRNCSCVKAGMACTNCLPSRRNGCRNPRNCNVDQLMPGPVPPTSTDLSGFLRILRTNYGQKVKNTDAPEGVASITVSGGFERYTEISRKIRRLRSLPTDCCKVDLEVLQVWFRPLPSASLRLLRHQPQLTPWCHRAPGLVREKLRIPN